MSGTTVVINCTVIVDDQQAAARAWDALARAACGLGLEGIQAGMNISTVDTEDQTVEEETA